MQCCKRPLGGDGMLKLVYKNLFDTSSKCLWMEFRLTRVTMWTKNVSSTK